MCKVHANYATLSSWSTSLLEFNWPGKEEDMLSGAKTQFRRDETSFYGSLCFNWKKISQSRAGIPIMTAMMSNKAPWRTELWHATNNSPESRNGQCWWFNRTECCDITRLNDDAKIREWPSSASFELNQKLDSQKRLICSLCKFSMDHSCSQKATKLCRDSLPNGQRH